MFIGSATAQSDIIFRSGFEIPVFILKLNDTGITAAVEYPFGNNDDCSSVTISAPQDCNSGRDASNNDPSDGHAGFSFIKLDASGNPLFDQTVAYGITPWACVHDNVTGLVWEIKTTSPGSLHYNQKNYPWGGLTAIGINHPNRQGTYHDDWNVLVEGSNEDNLCGYGNWRVPTVAEYSSIINKSQLSPALDTNYFPNTAFSWYWTSSPIAGSADGAWAIGDYDGIDFYKFRTNLGHVRLVRSGQ